MSLHDSLPWPAAFVRLPISAILSFFQPGIVPQSFPYYIHDEPGGNRRENITDLALQRFRTHFHDSVISKWSIFDYIYAMLLHPSYRAVFAGSQAAEWPPIPLASEFRVFQRAGQQLIQLHLDYQKLSPWELERVRKPNVQPDEKIGKPRLDRAAASLAINDSLTLSKIPPAVFDYRLGSRSALEWMVEQSAANPSSVETAESFTRRIGQVVRVSLDTLKIISELPPLNRTLRDDVGESA